MKDWRGLKAAQRAVPIPPGSRCEVCNGSDRLQRHHRDRDRSNNSPGNVAILCGCRGGCHQQEHIRAGDWPGMKRVP